MKSLLRIIALTGCVASLPAAPTAAATRATPAAAQCRGTDRIIPKQLRFARGRTTAVIKDTVRLCTAHEYHLRRDRRPDDERQPRDRQAHELYHLRPLGRHHRGRRRR